MTTPSVTIGWYPRERFSVAAESLEALLENSPDCRLIIVDPDTPSRYMEQIRAILGDRQVEIISTGRHILPSAARNLIIDRVQTDYVAFAENDVLVTPGWVENLIEACESTPADVATPLLIEGRGTSPHFDKTLGEIVESAKSEELYANPLHPYTKALLSAVPQTDPEKRRARIILQGDVPSPLHPPSGCRFHPRCPVAVKGLCDVKAPAMKDYGGHLAACHVVERGS